jgi:hypothetical protein
MYICVLIYMHIKHKYLHILHMYVYIFTHLVSGALGSHRFGPSDATAVDVYKGIHICTYKCKPTK